MEADVVNDVILTPLLDGVVAISVYDVCST